MSGLLKIVVPWHNQSQLDAFLAAWKVDTIPACVQLTQDTTKAGCARTKNRGVQEAIAAGAQVIVVLDDDCYPNKDATYQTLEGLAEEHLACLEPQPVELFEKVTNPASRGTPYFNHCVNLPVAASMGFWTGIGDYDAPGQLVHGARHPMEFSRKTIYQRYFPLCGMNLAFRAEWWPWCRFINVARFDDIWQGFLWQKEAYRRGFCFNLAGPLIEHARQSNVWANLRDEAKYLEHNETLWSDIAQSAETSYEELVKLLPPETQAD